jgi:hypothetical protein
MPVHPLQESAGPDPSSGEVRSGPAGGGIAVLKAPQRHPSACVHRAARAEPSRFQPGLTQGIPVCDHGVLGINLIALPNAPSIALPKT